MKYIVDEYEFKQHVNLSESAWITIQEDIKNFYENSEKETVTGFFNRIFTNFYQEADANIKMRLDQKYAELNEFYSSKEFKKLDKKLINALIDKHLKIYEEKLKDKAKSYEKGPQKTQKKIRINKQNIEILTDDENAGAEYYNNELGKYLKAIFEEYALKPSYVREQIFFLDTVKEIDRAIYNSKQLKITLNARLTDDNREYQRKFYVYPYKLLQNKIKTYNYLVGYSEEILDSNKKSMKTPACYRISRIQKIDTMVSYGAHISEDNKKELNQLLLERGVEFMASDVENIKIKFTDKGLELLKTHIYLRPNNYEISNDDKHIYIFKCNKFHATNYFFKFGWDAEIIEPLDLRLSFIQKYKSAFLTYQGKTKQEILNDLSNRNETA